MRLTRSSRLVIARLVAVVLLLCQTALFAAQACAHVAPAADAVAMPCHGDGAAAHEPGKQGPPAQSSCDAPKAVSDAAKVPVVALSDLPAIEVAYRDGYAPVVASYSRQPVLAVCHSPPRTALHCRLLN